MAQVEICKDEAKTGNGKTTEIDVTEVIENVRSLVSSVREIAGKPMDVKVDNFNFTFNKAADGEYGLSVDTKIIIKPK